LDLVENGTRDEFVDHCLEQVGHFLRCKNMHKDRGGGDAHGSSTSAGPNYLNHKEHLSTSNIKGLDVSMSGGLRDQLRADFVAAREDLRTRGRPILRGRMVRETPCTVKVDSTTWVHALPVLPPEVSDRRTVSAPQEHLVN
ncbi:unnamed protein product, partial [Amoebophrya sp. A25]